MQILGLHIDRPFLRGALIQKGRLGFKICELKTAPLKEPENVKQLYKHKFKGRLVSGLSSKDVMIRPMDLNIRNPRHIEAALHFQSEGLTHLNPAEVISIPHLTQKSPGKVEALLFSASREAIRSHLQECEKLHASLDCVSSNGLALTYFVLWKAPDLSEALIVHLGSHEWTCVLMERGKLKKSHALGLGTEALLTALWEDRKKILLPADVEEVAKQIDLQQMKAMLNPHLSAKLSELRNELAKVIFSFHRNADPKPVIFTGHIDAFKNLKNFLMEDLKEAISNEYGEKWKVEEKKFAIPIGLAIEQTEKPLQLLHEEFFPKKNWRRTGSYALLLIFFSIFLSCLLLSIGLKAIHDRKTEMVASIGGFIELWDPELKKTLIQDEEAALSQWVSKIANHNKEYPYILDVPRVAEVLSWLSQHPLLQEFKMENDPLEVKELRYKLMDYPKIGSQQTRYRAKIDLQFHIKSPMNARKFHETLLKGDEIVDPKGEISWEALNDGYRASFFLKTTRSPYVP